MGGCQGLGAGGNGEMFQQHDLHCEMNKLWRASGQPGEYR